MKNIDKVLILDFGSQFTQLITRRIRELNVYSEIHPFNIDINSIKEFNPKAIILSGGPSSVYEEDAPKIDKELLNLNIPILGICYGMQIIVHTLGGVVEHSEKREYGQTNIDITDNTSIFSGFSNKGLVLMSHGDSIKQVPEGFTVVAKTDNTPYAAIENKEKNIYAIQFHPEVNLTENGIKIIENFLFNICRCEKNWNMHSFIEMEIENIRETVGGSNVILGLSGGVDSSVAAVLIEKAIGKQLKCIFVNTGLLRKDEEKKVISIFRDNFNIELIYVDASKRFLDKLKGISDPEEKRKIIGYEFVKVFDEESKNIENAKFLAQGTLYPDVIESVSIRGSSAVIKSHHNVGGLPDYVDFKEIVEPLRNLFKDEVRKTGLELGIPENLVYRQPFPGPGLAIRIIGDITEDKLNILKDADAIFREEVANAGLHQKINQYFAVLTNLKSVGVMGDERTYDYTIALRAVETTDFMTGVWSKIPYEVLEKVSSRIVNEVKHVNRVVYDITSKPPATIEWE